MNISIDSIFIIDTLRNGFFYFRTYMPCSSFYINPSKIKRKDINIFFLVQVTTLVPVICIILITWFLYHRIRVAWGPLFDQLTNPYFCITYLFLEG